MIAEDNENDSDNKNNEEQQLDTLSLSLLQGTGGGEQIKNSELVSSILPNKAKS